MIALVCAAIFGLIVGSGLTSLVPRLAEGEKWHRGRSHCPRCRHALGVGDLVPVFSFLWNRGRCRYCRNAIGWFYPGIELATGALFVLSVLVRSGWDLSPDAVWDGRLWMAVFRDWTAISALLALFGIDLIAQVLPDAITLPAAAVLAVWNVALGESPAVILLGIAVGGGFFLIQYLASRGKWIGGGDIRLGAMLGALLGWPNILLALFVSYFLGAIVGMGLIVGKNKTWKSTIPFGTFLAVGGLFTLFWGQAVMDWYLGMIL